VHSDEALLGVVEAAEVNNDRAWWVSVEQLTDRDIVRFRSDREVSAAAVHDPQRGPKGDGVLAPPRVVCAAGAGRSGVALGLAVPA
jgi:hypothetical protein